MIGRLTNKSTLVLYHLLNNDNENCFNCPFMHCGDCIFSKYSYSDSLPIAEKTKVKFELDFDLDEDN